MLGISEGQKEAWGADVETEVFQEGRAPTCRGHEGELGRCSECIKEAPGENSRQEKGPDAARLTQRQSLGWLEWS